MNVRDLHQRLCDLVHARGDDQVLVVIHAPGNWELETLLGDRVWAVARVIPGPDPDDRFIVLAAEESPA